MRKFVKGIDMLKMLNARNLVILWLVGFLGSMVIQSFFQGWFAANTHWGSNPGWQNEIAIWNLGMILVVLGALKAGGGVERNLLLGLCVLSLLFAINHTHALFHSSSNIGNWMGATCNFLGVLLCGIYFLKSKLVNT